MSDPENDVMDDEEDEEEPRGNDNAQEDNEQSSDDSGEEDELDDENLPTRRTRGEGEGQQANGEGGQEEAEEGEEEDDDDEIDDDDIIEDGELQEEDGGFAQLPESVKGLRACKKCRLIKEFQQFVEIGCDNCRQFEDQEEAAEMTSPHFTGMMALVQPSESWSAKWQGAST